MTTVVGLSGGIGSGKSTVSAIFESLGATIVDADAIVHELQAPGTPLLAEIGRAFGHHVLRRDGSLDREALAALVFRDPEARQQLNALVHPRVGEEMLQRTAAAREAGSTLVVLDIPLLFESLRAATQSTSRPGLDATILVWAPAETQLRRTVARDGCNEPEARRRLDAQMPIDEKRELADYVIDNSGTREATRAQVEQIFEDLCNATA